MGDIMTYFGKSWGGALAVSVLALSLQGCVAAALAPTALSLAAEGVSVKSTGRTISENVKHAIVGEDGADDGQGEQMATLAAAGVVPVDDPNYDPEAEVAMIDRRIAPLPPRKPTPPGQADAAAMAHNDAAPNPATGDALTLSGRARSIGDFIN